MVKGITTIIGMIPKGGRFAKSVVNFVHEVPQNWGKFKSAIQQIDDLLKQGKLKLDGKQKTIFESNKNILKNHEKVQKSVFKNPPYKASPVKKPEDHFKGWTPTVVERQNLRKIYKDKLNPPERLYTKEMEAIDEELNELMLYGNSKYAHLSESQKATMFEKLQAEMQKLIKVAKENDPTKLSLSQLNKKSHALQKRIREIADNPNIPGTVTEGPKHDMIKALYDNEHKGIYNAASIIKRKNAEKKYGKKFPVLDPDNEAFIVMGLDERGNPLKVSRFIGKFSSSPDKTTGKWKRSGTSFYDKWNSKSGKIRKEGEEVFHETLDTKGNVIMSNPNYKIPEIKNMEIWNELYNESSINDLAQKGYKLKDIDMLVKARLVRKYLDKTRHKDHNIAMHEQTSTGEIGEVMEDLYTRGDDVYKMSIKEWTKKIPEYFAHGGSVPGFATGGISNLFRQRQGFRTGTIAKLPEFLKFVEKLLIKASNEIRQGIGKWKGLDQKQRIVQHDNLTKLATEFQKTKKFDKSFNEYFGIDAEKAFIEAQAKVKPVKKTRTMDDLVEDAYQEVFHQKPRSGDYKYDADVLATEIAYQGGKIYDDLAAVEKAGIYDLALKRVSKDLQINRAKKIAEKNLKDLEQKIELQMFDTTGKKGNAEGGLIGYATGGVSNLFRRR